jgi:hypothetical protein
MDRPVDSVGRSEILWHSMFDLEITVSKCRPPNLIRPLIDEKAVIKNQ